MEDEIDAPASNELDSRSAWGPASFYLPSYYKVGDKGSHTARLSIPLGLPLDGYADEYDRADEQEDLLAAYITTIWPAIEKLRVEYEVAGEPMALRWIGSGEVLNGFFMSFLRRDILFAGEALWFVILFTITRMRSIWVAALCMVGVVLSFADACFWMIVVCGISYFDPLNVFLLFILLGLGADGIFIVFDTWEQSREALSY
mmetsp:Transcript_28691/g.65807  ORF Transcript_28691/g.65807 Transcript_28691/m.65807 type:complete len:202 (-) Transcript_28691:2081-2686(-)